MRGILKNTQLSFSERTDIKHTQQNNNIFTLNGRRRLRFLC